jgi:hypothetical protein
MIQNSIIAIILVACALYIGRRVYNNIKGSQQGCGCGCSCSGCGPDVVSSCHPDEKKSSSK